MMYLMMLHTTIMVTCIYNSDRSRFHTNKIELKTVNFSNEYVYIPPTIGPTRGAEELEFPLIDGESVDKGSQ